MIRVCLVCLTSCVLIRFAPFNAQTNSAATDGIKRSSGSRLNIFPINDFLETQTQIGFKKVFSLARFDITSRSRIYQGSSIIFVRMGFVLSP